MEFEDSTKTLEQNQSRYCIYVCFRHHFRGSSDEKLKNPKIQQSAPNINTAENALIRINFHNFRLLIVQHLFQASRPFATRPKIHTNNNITTYCNENIAMREVWNCGKSNYQYALLSLYPHNSKFFS